MYINEYAILAMKTNNTPLSLVCLRQRRREATFPLVTKTCAERGARRTYTPRQPGRKSKNIFSNAFIVSKLKDQFDNKT